MADHDPLAAELALGLLEGDERAVAMRRVLADADFAGDVEWWRGQFAALFDLWPEIAAPAHLATRIQASIDADPVASAAVVPIARRGFPWPALAIVTSALAACLLLILLIAPGPSAPVSQPVPAPRATTLMVATLDANAVPVAAVFDPAAGSLRIAAPPGIPADRVAQLWVIGGDHVPHALGLLGRTATTLAPPLSDRARIERGATLAISVEPVGGSPTGLPTGPVIATGTVARV